MDGEHPFRQDGERPIFSEQAELDAIAWLAAKKDRLSGVCVALGVAGAAAAVGLSLLWAHQIVELYQTYISEEHGNPLMGPLAAIGVVPLGLAHLVGRLLLRSRRRVWLAQAAERFGVPAEVLAWVVGDGPRDPPPAP